MTRSRGDVWLHRFAWMLAVATLFLVALGGVVTTKGVGMAVPDWPTTYGDHMFLFPYSKWVGGVFDEHSHRLWASLVGLFTALMLGWVWVRQTKGRQRTLGLVGIIAALGLIGVRNATFFVVFAVIAFAVMIYGCVRFWRERSLPWLLAIAFCAVLVQGVLGGLRVTLDVHGWGTEFGIFHGAFAQLFFLLVGSIVMLTSEWWGRAAVAARPDSGLRRLLLAVTAVIFLQLIFGASMRHQHAGLAIPDFPLAYGKLWPDTSVAAVESYNQHRLEAAGEHPITATHIVLHMLHRITALVIVAGIIAAAASAWRQSASGALIRKLMGGWIGLIVVQVTLGAFTIWSQRKVDVTTAHVAVGALTFLLGWLSYVISSREGVLSGVVAAHEMVADKGAADLKHA